MRRIHESSRLEDLPPLLKDKKVVLANGCFDILHVGHLDICKPRGNWATSLVVAVNSDKSVRPIKDPGRPIMAQEERVALVSALRCVDYVVLFDEPDVSRVLERPSALQFMQRAPTTPSKLFRNGLKCSPTAAPSGSQAIPRIIRLAILLIRF